MAKQKADIVEINRGAFSLQAMFVILSASCVFFAVLKVSPLAAFIVSIFVAPALIRTAWSSDLHRRNKEEFEWYSRLGCFVESCGVVLLTYLIGFAAFAVVCLLFGFLGMLFGLMVSADLWFDAAVLGVTGGIVWGMAGAMMAIIVTATRIWPPKLG